MKKKKKINKSTGDLAVADVVLVDIDIDGDYPRSVSVGDPGMDDHLPPHQHGRKYERLRS